MHYECRFNLTMIWVPGKGWKISLSQPPTPKSTDMGRLFQTSIVLWESGLGCPCLYDKGLSLLTIFHYLWILRYRQAMPNWDSHSTMKVSSQLNWALHVCMLLPMSTYVCIYGLWSSDYSIWICLRFQLCTYVLGSSTKTYKYFTLRFLTKGGIHKLRWRARGGRGSLKSNVNDTT